MISVAEAPPRNGIMCSEIQSITESQPGCDRFETEHPISVPYKLASREWKAEDSLVTVRPEEGISFQAGSGYFGVIGGPCTVESESQIVESAKTIRRAGGKALRGGAFKPRTSPYSFQGLKEEGLKMLATARAETGLAVVTEVMSLDKVELVASYADVLQIGSRNMHNYPLLEAVGAQRKPVLLKRGLCATLSEFLLAAEYILAQGNENVMLCERGIRTFESDTRFTLSLGSVAVLKEQTHLPIIVDPSHATGKASIIRPLCRASIAAGCDGLLIEVHPDPSHAVCDGEQSIGVDLFAHIMGDMRELGPVLGKKLS